MKLNKNIKPLYKVSTRHWHLAYLFPVPYGAITSTMFLVYINYLIQYLNSLGVGINISGRTLCALLYADDIVLLANNPQDLQKISDGLCVWCKKWKLIVNESKSTVVHFRGKRVKRVLIRINLKLVGIKLNTQIVIHTLGCILINIWNTTIQQHNLQKVDSEHWVRLYTIINIT